MQKQGITVRIPEHREEAEASSYTPETKTDHWRRLREQLHIDHIVPLSDQCSPMWRGLQPFSGKIELRRHIQVPSFSIVNHFVGVPTLIFHYENCKGICGQISLGL